MIQMIGQYPIQFQGFSVNSAKIVSSNHEAGNGVIHVIDSVLTPPTETAFQRIREQPALA